MIRQEEVYKIGRIGKPHGFKGEVQMQCNDDVFDRTDADYLVLDIDGIMVPFFIDEYRFRSDESVLMKFTDIDSDDKARELTGCNVYFPRHLADSDDAPSKAEIIGYVIVDANNGNEIGTLESIDESTQNIIFTVRSSDEREILIPAILMKDINKDTKTISMDIPEGLIDL